MAVTRPTTSNQDNSIRKRTIKSASESKLTRFYSARKAKAYLYAEKVRDAFFGDSWVSAIMWTFVVLACLSILAWFFLVSSYGTPAEPVYEGF